MTSDPNERCELLPCPFCGGDGEIEETTGSQASGSSVVFRGNCKTVGHVSLTWTPDRAEAIAAWNTRSEQRWQPIETAPKDGTRILIARAGEDVGVAEIEITEWCSIEGYHWEHVEGDLWRKVPDAPAEFWNGNGHRATHWQPLPELPHPNEEQN